MATSRLVFSHAMTSAKDPGMREELAVGSQEAYCSFVSANAREGAAWMPRREKRSGGTMNGE